jgi:hypothetical protein
MAKHSETSWKPKTLINQANNSVDKATHAVSQAATHPSDLLIQQAQNAMDRAENGFNNALIESENLEPVQRLQEQLNQNQEQLDANKKTKSRELDT